MKPRTFLFWTGGRPLNSPDAKAFAENPPPLGLAAPLATSAIIEFYWGDTRFEMAVAACSIRVLPWGDEKVTWLHVKAAETGAVKPDQPTPCMTLLVPAHYVTSLKPGSGVCLTKTVDSNPDIGVFAPVQAAPLGAIPLPEIEAVLAKLLASDRN